MIKKIHGKKNWFKWNSRILFVKKWKMQVD